MKRFIAGIALLVASVVSFAQTYPSPTYNNLTVNGTATFTSGVNVSQLSNIAANTVLANVTSAAAGVTAYAMPSCSASGSALQYTSGTGWTCASGYALLASPTFTGTPAAPTAAAGTNTTQVATTAYVTTATGGSTSVSVAGGSNVTLTAAQAGTPNITLTGALTASINLIVPGVGKWTIVNNSTGAFTITVKTASGTGVAVAQGFSGNLWSDGTNVYTQMTDYITWFNSLPTSLPASAGVLWNNGGSLAKS